MNNLIKNYFLNKKYVVYNFDIGDVLKIQFNNGIKNIEIVGQCIKIKGHMFNKHAKILVNKKYIFSFFVSNPKYKILIIDKKAKRMTFRKINELLDF